MRMLATAAIVAVILVPGVPEAEIATGQVVLNCEIEEGAPEGNRTTQIMIDETNAFVIYHFQHHNSSVPTRVVELEDGKKGEVDFSMKITINNNRFIMADDMDGAFMITKHDGRFVHAFVSPIPLNDGNFVASATSIGEPVPKAPLTSTCRTPHANPCALKGTLWPACP